MAEGVTKFMDFLGVGDSAGDNANKKAAANMEHQAAEEQVNAAQNRNLAGAQRSMAAEQSAALGAQKQKMEKIASENPETMAAGLSQKQSNVAQKQAQNAAKQSGLSGRSAAAMMANAGQQAVDNSYASNVQNQQNRQMSAMGQAAGLQKDVGAAKQAGEQGYAAAMDKAASNKRTAAANTNEAIAAQGRVKSDASKWGEATGKAINTAANIVGAVMSDERLKNLKDSPLKRRLEAVFEKYGSNRSKDLEKNKSSGNVLSDEQLKAPEDTREKHAGITAGVDGIANMIREKKNDDKAKAAAAAAAANK